MQKEIKTQLNRQDIDMIFKIWHGKFDHRDDAMVEQAKETYNVLTKISVEEVMERVENASN